MAISDKVVLMNKGNIAQVGSPKDIYENPNSKFVANFIGKSNFIPCKVVGQENDKMVVQSGDQTIKLPQAGAFAPKVNENAVMVARPEAVHLVETGGIFKGTVKKATYYGNQIEYKVTMNGIEIVIESYRPQASHIFNEGDQVGVDLDLQCIRLLADGDEE
jgi:iron(III) transport system ATP-binding protein